MINPNHTYGIINEVYRPFTEINTPSLNLGIYNYDLDKFNGDTTYNYNQLIEVYKTEKFIITSSNKEDDFNKEDMNLMEKIVNIKKKIKEMKDKNKIKIDDMNKRNELNKKMEELKKILIENNNKYKYFVNLHTQELYPEYISKLPEGITLESYDELKDENVINLKNMIQYNNQKINENKEIIFETSERINTIKNIIYCKELIEDGEQNESKNKCSICKESDVIYCMNPCGHTFCDNCSPIIFKPCHICRGDVRNKIKIFFT